MKRLLGIGLVTVLALVLWVGLVATGARNGWGRAEPAAKDDTAGFVRWAQARYAAESKGDFAMVLIDHGHVAGSYFASHGRPVDGDSLFQVASMSKWVTAWGVMALAEQHRIDLDAPVSRYLKRWRLPPSQFNNDDVTVRRLLSHTAGLTDGLGFLGFAPGQPRPTIAQELTHIQDGQPGASGIVRVGAKPGDTWRYSGGGYLILQLMIEDVTGQSFNDYMRQTVLRPLGMTSSTFVDPDPNHLADDYDRQGNKIAYARFTALSAAGLFTSTTDMTRFITAQLPGPAGAPAGGGVLKPTSLETMRQPRAFLFGMPVWGLGESLYAPNGAGGYVIGHDGGNYPAINTTARIDPATGDGIVLLQSGNHLLAAEIGGEWLFWRTGKVGIDTLVELDAERIAIQLGAGALVILIGGGLVAWRGRRRRRA